jgi:hypothetical protein
MLSSDSKRRTGPQILAALEAVVKAAGEVYPKSLIGDQEFNKEPMTAWYKKHGIETYFSEPTQLHKNALVERFHRTFKGLTLRYWLGLESKHDLSVKEVSRLLEVYNETIHSTTKQTPDDMHLGTAPSHQDVVSKEEATVKAFTFTVGQRVRVRQKKGAFGGDSSVAAYSEREFIIDSISGARFTLRTLQGKVIDDQTYAFYQLKYSGEGDGDVAGDKRAEARQVTTDKRKRKAKGARALAKSGVGDSEAYLRGPISTRRGRRAATSKTARAAYLESQ